jgi:hypothetical protein
MSQRFDGLLKLCLPLAFRRRAWLHLRAIERARRIKENARIPYCELEARHIRHARLILDRAELLRSLPRGGVVAEIGVDKGDFSEQILAATKPAKLHLVDAWGSDRYHAGKGLAVETRFAPRIAGGTVAIDRGLSTAVLPRFPDAYFDWVYIDSDHGYAVTAEELRLAESKVKPGGFIAGHDYVTCEYEKDVRYGVVEAVHEFCVKHNWELRLLTTETHQHRSFAISRLHD